MKIMFDKPHANTCSNTHRDDHWTCPGCYHDLGDIGEGEHVCPHCNRAITCTLKQVPECVCRLSEMHS
jgi:hypothetical protein